MNDLFEALKKSINDYVNVDKLPERRKRRVKEVYSKFTYNYETVDGLFEQEEQGNAKK